MGLLFKTTLVHIKKNSFVVFVLSFFISSGIVVLSSSDMLRDNLNKGFQEVNFDGNPHDLILLSKSFKSDQNLKVMPVYEDHFASLQLTPRWGYRWAFDNLKGDFYVRAAEYNKVSNSAEGGSSGAASSTKGTSPKLKKLPEYSFHIPIIPNYDYSYANQ